MLRPVRHDVNGARAASLADEAPRLRKINESEARGRADRVERHERIVLAGAVQTPYAHGADALGAKIGDGRRGGALGGNRTAGMRPGAERTVLRKE